MSWYRRSKLAAESFTSLAAKFLSENNPVLESISRRTINQSDYLVPSLNKFGVSRNLGFQFGVKQSNQYSQFLGISRRYYYVDRHQIRHFKQRGPWRWFENPRYVFVVVIVGSGIFISVYLGNLETIPYTKRKHFVLLSRTLEKQMGEAQFGELKRQFKGKILPAIHPDSVRVRLIAKDIIDALQRGLKKEQVWTDPGYASDTYNVGSYDAQETLKALSENAEGMWTKEDEILDDKWVQQCRKKGEKQGSVSYTQHLEGLNWEILVVNDPIVNAFCLPGGKIVVFTGLLKHFRTDEEIATIIGHEVAHAVARHSAEGITKNMWFTIIQLTISWVFAMPDLVRTLSHLLLRLPFSRRMEMEADYIGLLLLASAGYDPRVAPKVYEKLGEIGGESALRDYLSTHPSGKKRARLLSQAKVMEEAFAIYREAKLGHGVEGFL